MATKKAKPKSRTKYEPCGHIDYDHPQHDYDHKRPPDNPQYPDPGLRSRSISMRCLHSAIVRAKASTTEEPDAGKLHVRDYAGGAG